MREIYRILDANLNRAREAMRVVEDFARFALDDAALSAAAKDMRSRLRELSAPLPADGLLAARDTPADVGTEITSATEMARPDAAAVVAAAFKRLTEALRTLAEYAKIVAPATAEGFEALRYQAYTLERDLGQRLCGSRRFAEVRLYVLLTSDLARGEPVEVAEAAIRGGADCIQLREKEMPDGRLLDLARRLRRLTRQAGAGLIINDRPDIAAAAGADGVHLGQDDLPVAAARRVLPPWAIVGLSTHNPAQLRAAIQAGSDYIAVGPMFPTATKDAGPVAGVDYLRRGLAESPVPVVPIGGINAANVPRLTEAGAERVAVCSAVIAAEDPAA
ncbi:MAG: thiamine phosphate synthase, partial [Planctomycetota bacterium]